MRTWAGSTRSMLQSLKPTLASEKVLVSGGLSMARATISVGLRSGPYQGFARAPFVGLRVVATSSMGRSASADVSCKLVVTDMLVQPPTYAAAPVEARVRNNSRRESFVPGKGRMFTQASMDIGLAPT